MGYKVKNDIKETEDELIKKFESYGFEIILDPKEDEENDEKEEENE